MVILTTLDVCGGRIVSILCVQSVCEGFGSHYVHMYFRLLGRWWLCDHILRV